MVKEKINVPLPRQTYYDMNPLLGDHNVKFAFLLESSCVALESTK